jgi:molybdenum cofactor cytidylyltransferase
MTTSRDPDDALPVVEPPATTRSDREATVWGVLLAAGSSSRYGDRNKLLEPLAGTPVVSHAVETLTSSQLDGVTVVVGYEADRVRRAVDDAVVEVRVNDAHADGQSTSVRVGVEAARDHGADAVVIALGDMPHVTAATVDKLVAAYERGAGSALAAGYRGRRGNPVLFDARFFDALTDVTGDTGGRRLLHTAADAAVVDTDDPGTRQDIDHPADLSDGDGPNQD